MLADRALLGEHYLAHLTGSDLALLAGASELSGAPEALRGRPSLIAELMERPELADLVFTSAPDERGLFGASPFLVFSVAVHQTARGLAGASYVEEWLGPNHRTPVFDVSGLRDFLDDDWRRLFLAELLGSYTKVTSGSIAVPTRRGMRRQRFSELDPVRLASLLDVVSESEHAGIYRRLGDLALFLTGVFPDHTARHGWSSLDEARLLRAGRLDPHADTPSASLPGFGDASAVELLERLGRRWYQLAADLVGTPTPLVFGPVASLSRRFGEARRVLNVLTDHYLFPLRQELFGGGPGGR